MIAFRALAELKDGEKVYPVGALVPGAAKWRTLDSELRLQRIEAVRVDEAGRISHVPYLLNVAFDGHARGEVVTGLDKHPEFRLLRMKGALVPVLTDDAPAKRTPLPPTENQKPSKHWKKR